MRSNPDLGVSVITESGHLSCLLISPGWVVHDEKGKQHLRQTQREHIQAALALLLGPETEYTMRVRATRRLAKQGPAILPLYLATLSNYPEITAPAWPWWPPQYEHCSRLLLHLCQQAQLSLAEVLLHPVITQPAGPVLWTSVMEAAAILPHIDYEELLCQGLATPWMTVRYAAALALATRGRKTPLHSTTLKALHAHQGPHENYPVRLTTSYALLIAGEPVGLEVLIVLLDQHVPAEVRKAAMFILATDPPAHLSITQREQLTHHLLASLHDEDNELSLQAGHALSRIATPSILPILNEMLTHTNSRIQVVVLTTLEELAQRKNMRLLIRHLALPARILPLLKSEMPDVRRQASYTLAVCGGEYVAAALGTIVMNIRHPGHIEAIEGLRLLHGALRAPLRNNVVRWLLCVLQQQQEEVLVTTLDTLAYLLWQARAHRQKQAWHTISQEITRDGTTVRLLQHESAWVRQRAIELLMMLDNYLNTIPHLQSYLTNLLHNDDDSGVRACVAYACGQIGARWAIPGLLYALLDSDEQVALTALATLEQIATVDDLLVTCTLTELTYYQLLQSPNRQTLAREAQSLLKRWHRADITENKKKLHTLP